MTRENVLERIELDVFGRIEKIEKKSFAASFDEI